MIGTIINTLLILLGSFLGLLISRGIPQRVRDTVMMAMGLSTLLIGLSGALKTTDTLCVIVCMGVGSLLGSLLNIEAKLDQLGHFLEKKLSHSGEAGSIGRGFVTATLVYCVGAMAIVGSIDSALRGDHSTLIAKGVIDGLTAVIFTSSLGIGVALSAVSVLLYQGAIALLASLLAPILTESVILEMSAVGGLLIAAIGLNLVYDKHIPVGNMLPAIFLPLAYLPLAGLFA
ncbi:MAG: DUF554 domain-containing protein [Clostridia bacterium]|nr:DUF554 domain-containing protein [Clostridia bacterium]